MKLDVENVIKLKNKYLELAIKEAKKAYKKEEVPIGCVIVKDNKVIAKAYNKKKKTNDPTDHAEIIAIKKAAKKLKYIYLENAEIYITLEPCMMCLGAIINAKINKIYYGTKQDIRKNMVEEIEKYNIEYVNLENEECNKLLKDFFKDLRKRK